MLRPLAWSVQGRSRDDNELGEGKRETEWLSKDYTQQRRKEVTGQLSLALGQIIKQPLLFMREFLPAGPCALKGGKPNTQKISLCSSQGFPHHTDAEQGKKISVLQDPATWSKSSRAGKYAELLKGNQPRRISKLQFGNQKGQKNMITPA
ncbi:hypothetical protein HPP92_029111 [Vanilla planifolia]|uniref:Uncharacterized protein n=1 Tax=Vanilla planifolia TaxID=51239 RepID=A0A835U1F5_VANPL|nr:hypothetical protein HPP92_029111 [Vanilla planifolia]KAG0445899.1 hypothetical protein HPP92_029100 [Vanilla planifolia]